MGSSAEVDAGAMSQAETIDASAVRQDRPAAGSMAFVRWASTTLAVGLIPGALLGGVIGGVGSRLAMRIMAMTSPHARGFETDFGATVGAITPSGTIFLLIAGGLVGVFGGLVYLAVRRLLPGRGWIKGALFGVVLLAIGGRILLVPDNPDFLILDPLGLAVAMFAALPLLFGLALVPLAEWLEPWIRRFDHPIVLASTDLVLLFPFILLSGIGMLPIVVCLAVWWVRGSVDPVSAKGLRAVGTVLLAGLVVWLGTVFVLGVVDILS